MIRSLFLSLIAVLFVLPAAHAQEPDAAHLLDLGTFPRTTLEIHSGKETHTFNIWLAQTEQQQQQGLMFVRDLPPDRGMLFLSAAPRVFTMWMKNTYIPLDMVFIAPDHRIAKIAANTTPHSLDIISSDVAVAGILELKAGEAARRSLHAGDRVDWTAPGK
jgi:uncharacterized membrane protein (UPF0127 family)